MKLRNKKTGEIITKIDISQDKESIWILEHEPRIYHSLAELNEEWEDYVPVERDLGETRSTGEPLINLKIDDNQKLLIEEAVAMFASQDKLRGGYHVKQAQEILHMLVNAELCGEEE